jgi:hypothetical protein
MLLSGRCPILDNQLSLPWDTLQSPVVSSPLCKQFWVHQLHNPVVCLFSAVAILLNYCIVVEDKPENFLLLIKFVPVGDAAKVGVIRCRKPARNDHGIRLGGSTHFMQGTRHQDSNEVAEPLASLTCPLWVASVLES